MEVMEIGLSELVPKALTRTRGTEASEALFTRLMDAKPDRVVVHLSGINLVSGSFVDELVVKSQKFQEENGVEVVYRVSDKEMLTKLAKTAGLRELTLRYLRKDSNELLNVNPIRPTEMNVVNKKDIWEYESESMRD